MRILALAKCINARHSDDVLIGGEFYLIEHHSKVVHPETPIHQGNVLVYHIPEKDLILGNFEFGWDLNSREVFYVANSNYTDLMQSAPLDIVAHHRFELVFLSGQFNAACHRAKDRIESMERRKK